MHNIFQIISYINNVIAFLALFVVFVIGYRIFLNSCVIYDILKYGGISRMQAFSAGFRCRNDHKIQLRQFVEYCICVTGGKMQNRNEWTKIAENFFRRKLEQKISSSKADFVIFIENTFHLSDEILGEAVGRYFEYFKDPRVCNRFSIDPSLPLQFLSRVRVKKGYLAPLSAISGLQQRYQQDWTPILNNYVRTLDADKEINRTELYFLYNWLMWGPSCEVDYGENDYKLLLYGLGDESKSLNLVLGNGNNSSALWKKMETLLQKYRFGTQCEIEAKIYEPNSYFDHNSARFSCSAMPFIRSICAPNSNVKFILENFHTNVDIMSQDRGYLFCAYLWVMLARVADSDSPLQIEKATTFYEHVNLADAENYAFLMQMLIDKIFCHLKNLSKHSFNGYIKYVFSFNKQTENLFIEHLESEIEKGGEFAEFLQKKVITTERFEQANILKELDNYFPCVAPNIDFIDLDLSKDEDRVLLCRFYGEVFYKNFPDNDERESLDNILKQFNARGGKNNYHVAVAKSKDKIIAGAIADYFGKNNLGVIEFIVVDETFRWQGIGSRMRSYIIGRLNEDANKNNYQCVDYVFIEVDDPEKSREQKTLAESRLKFWENDQYKRIKFNYVQPSLSSDKNAVNHLWLCVKCFAADASKDTIPSETVGKFLYDYMKYAFDIPDPDTAQEFVQMSALLSQCEEQQLSKIIH